MSLHNYLFLGFKVIIKSLGNFYGIYLLLLSKLLHTPKFNRPEITSLKEVEFRSNSAIKIPTPALQSNLSRFGMEITRKDKQIKKFMR